ncbi:hypothetical protein FOZ76_04900 [Verticiella sediminum]|uniref:DUF2158 domain-containing protein n=1 Tax=Verticiella sediminum TaxID=1247510 RepID=A0A556AZ03_9BURK|nr:hypothetical protein [Verticiella sediminum]TSH98126.1 hypothetical protein FOZ76_04900 [Verticiella sediminum]
MLNLMDIQPGQCIRLTNGVTGEVIENAGDGMWVKARFEAGDEELVFCEDIAGLVSPPVRARA